MKELIKQIDSLSILIKIILAIPALDIVWGIYRIIRALDDKNTMALVISIILLFVPFMWLIDIICIILKGNVWYYSVNSQSKCNRSKGVEFSKRKQWN